MNRDDIIRMAREAGWKDLPTVRLAFAGFDLARFADLVRADERERIKAEPNVEYERGFIDGMQMQTKSSVDRAVNRMAEPVQTLNAWAADRLARHGIQACLYPNCVGGQNGTVCHKHCPTPCTDCRGVGYDASGQLCACQQNPSF